MIRGLQSSMSAFGGPGSALAADLRVWAIRAVAVAIAFILGAPSARAGDTSFDRLLGWNREANAIVVAEWEWPGKEAARERPLNLYGRSLDSHVGGLAMNVRCDWPEKAVLVGVDAPDARFACRWRAGNDGPERATESIGFRVSGCHRNA